MPKCLFYPITFSGENDYRLSNACRCMYFVMRFYWRNFNRKFNDYNFVNR